MAGTIQPAHTSDAIRQRIALCAGDGQQRFATLEHAQDWTPAQIQQHCRDIRQVLAMIEGWLEILSRQDPYKD